MATITYQFFQSTPAGMLTPTLTGNQMLPSLAALDGGGFVMVSNTGGLADLEAVAFDQLAPVRTGLFSQPAVNATTAGHQFGAQTVGLSGGGWVTVYNDTSAGQSEVRARFFASDGTALGSDFLISSGAGDPDVVGGIAELANGNVAVTYQKNIQSTNGDIWVRVMTDTGTPVSSLAVDTSINVDSLDPAIAGLSGGGFVVVWVERAADNSTEIYARRYDASNAAIGGKTLIDTGGSVNDQPEVLALADGGYAIAYRDNGWNARSGDDITMKIFNGDGSARSGLIRANSGDLAGAQSDPHLAQLDNGFIVLTWTSDNTAGSSETSIYSRIFAADGTAITSTTAIAADPVATEAHSDVIGLGSGKMILAWDSSDPLIDGSGSAVVMQQAELVRYTVGDGTGETLTGDELADSILGKAGNDVIDGGGGDDNIEGGEGADQMAGGAGYDTLSYNGSLAGVTINLATGEAAGGDADGDTFSGFERIKGSNFGDTLTGNAEDNWMTGNSGDDILDGGDGDDILYGEEGNDHFMHSLGADAFIGGNGAEDWVDYSLATAAVIVGVGDGATEAGAALGDIVDETVEWITGSDFNDVITGSAADNRILGGKGADRIEGGVGADVLDGGAGTNTLLYTGSAAAVTVNLGTNTAAGGDAEGDVISQFSRAVGSQFNDKLTGSDEANVLTGGLGADTLTGGLGKDIFDYNDLADSTVGQAGRDIIKDFDEAGVDKIDLSGIDADNLASGNNAFSFIGSAAFTALGQVRVTQNASNTIVEVNAKGDIQADMRIILTGLHTLDAADFVL